MWLIDLKMMELILMKSRIIWVFLYVENRILLLPCLLDFVHDQHDRKAVT